jgi:large subunit ribosomal protein L17
MRHMKTGRKLGRNSAHRRAMFRNMVTSLILHGRVTTTDAKAKELRRYADRMITLGKQQTLSARRRAARFVRTNAAVARLFNEVAPLFERRAGGYTRIVKIGHRHGDAAPIAVVELTEKIEPVAPQRGGDKARGLKTKAAKADTDGAKAKSKDAKSKGAKK